MVKTRNPKIVALDGMPWACLNSLVLKAKAHVASGQRFPGRFRQQHREGNLRGLKSSLTQGRIDLDRPGDYS